MYSIQIYDDELQAWGEKITQGLQSPINISERLDGGIDTARVVMHTKSENPPKQWQKLRLWTTTDEPLPAAAGWTEKDAGSSFRWRGHAYGQGTFIVTSGTRYVQITRDNGDTWEQVDFGNPTISSVGYGNGRFVLIGGNRALYSDDAGITWQAGTVASGLSLGGVKIVYGNGRFMALITNNSVCYTSADGISWISTGGMPSAMGATPWTDLAYGNGMWVAIATRFREVANIVYSTNGTTWTAFNKAYYQWPFNLDNVTSMIFYNGKFYVFAGALYSTTDFENWEWCNIGFNAISVTHGDGRVFALSYNLGVTRSYWTTDLLNWHEQEMPSNNMRQIAYAGERFFALPERDGVYSAFMAIEVDKAIPASYVDYFIDRNKTTRLTRFPDLKVYRWELDLVGLIKVTQKLPMGNLCFSNDVSETGVVTQKTYSEVLNRLNNQIFTVLEEDRADVPFKLRITPAYIPFLSEYSPELFFTGNTLFECLERIGLTQDSFPELFYYAPGEYLLSFRKFNNPNAERHAYENFNAVDEYYEADNHAEIVDSTVENYLYADSKYANGTPSPDTAMVYPMIGQYAAVGTDEYAVEITQDNALVRLPFPVSKVLKVECKTYAWTAGGWASAENDATNKVEEYDVWKTLPEDFWSGTWWGETQSKGRQGYYQYNGVTIARLKAVANLVSALTDDPRGFMFRVTYEPLLSLRLKVQKTKTSSQKPITTIANQQANVLDGAEFSNHLQVLADRMSGERTTLIVKLPLGEEYHKGEYLNGEVITQADHTYFRAHVESIYTTSKHYSRKSEFVEVDHNLRQWSIPADRVQNRHLNYSEIVHVSLSPEDGYIPQSPATSLNTGGVELICKYLAGELTVPPTIAKIAWKTKSDVDNDSHDNSINYALASCKGTPAGKSVLFTWAATDVASMGSRGYYRHEALPADYHNQAHRQQFVQYDAKSEVLQFMISANAPSSFIFNSYYTGTGIYSGVLEDKVENQKFETTFPLSKKQQFTEDVEPIIDLTARANQYRLFRIQKDLRERIIFNYQLDFIGSRDTIIANAGGGTIVFPSACVWCGLTNKTPFENLRLFVSNDYRYLGSETKPPLNATEKLVYSRSYTTPSVQLNIGTGVSGLTSYAITDENQNLMFAYNSPFQETVSIPSVISLHFSVAKKIYKKI